MKCDPKLKRADFWKIQCFVCGINTDLLIDNYQRIICREHLNEYEFSEVEHEGLSESDKEVETQDSVRLSCQDFREKNGRDNWIQNATEFAKGIK
jgi:hypothetical protein